MKIRQSETFQMKLSYFSGASVLFQSRMNVIIYIEFFNNIIRDFFLYIFCQYLKQFSDGFEILTTISMSFFIGFANFELLLAV